MFGENLPRNDDLHQAVRAVRLALMALTGASSRRRQLEMQVFQSPDDEGRFELVAARPPFAVHGLGDGDIARVIEKAIQDGGDLGPRERGAGAGVYAPAERDVLADSRSLEPEFVRIVAPATRVAVAGSKGDDNRLARGHFHAADRGVPTSHPVRGLAGALEAKNLLDHPGDQLAVVAQLLLQAGYVHDIAHGVAEQLGAGVLAGGKHEDGQADEFGQKTPP